MARRIELKWEVLLDKGSGKRKGRRKRGERKTECKRGRDRKSPANAPSDE